MFSRPSGRSDDNTLISACVNLTHRSRFFCKDILKFILTMYLFYRQLDKCLAHDCDRRLDQLAFLRIRNYQSPIPPHIEIQTNVAARN